MIIDNVQEKDKETISKWIYKDNYTVFNYAVQTNGWVDKHCCNDEDFCYVARVENSIVGVFMFITQKSNEFRVLINPDMLSKGYGKTLIKKALNIGYKELKFKEISLIVRKNHEVAIRLYEKLGFKKMGETQEMVGTELTDFYKMLNILKIES